MDDHSAPAFRNAGEKAKSTSPQHSRSIQSLRHQTLIGDWYFESNCNLRKTAPINRLVGESRAMVDLRERTMRYAETEETVLISGETGTGKERIARAIHELSPRANRRLVAVNCAAIPAELLESELFGYRKGAFTGAERDRAGLFEEADGGTLFLDEIGEMRLSLQAKLTRALEERAVRRVGDNRERSLDVRIVAATHRDLEAMARAGTFREDLWYRLNVAVLEVPPLRDRAEDIEALAVTFLRDVAGTIVEVDAPGLGPADLTGLDYENIPKDIYPLSQSEPQS